MDKNIKLFYNIEYCSIILVMKQKKIDFVKLLKGYKSGWVAISSDYTKVVLSGNTLKEVMSKAKKIRQKLYFFPAEGNYSGFIG